MGEFKSRKPRVDLSRPVVDLGNGSEREWRTVTAKDLDFGDVISGRGIVKMVFEACDSTWYIEAGDDTEEFFPDETEFFAFVRKGN